MLLCWRLFVVVVVGRVTLIVGLPPRLTSPWLLGIVVMMFRVEYFRTKNREVCVS